MSRGTRPDPARRPERARVPLAPTGRATLVAAVLALPVIPLVAPPDEPAAPPSSPGPVTAAAAAPLAVRADPVKPAGHARPVAPPSGLVVPSIGLATGPPELLGLDPAGTLGAPVDFARTGWWAGGPKPGQAGPAVIVGHVDSAAGPAVFFRLREIPVGTQIVVPRTDGRKTTFTVDAVRSYPKDHFPSAEVYGATANAQLRLITCGGAFDRAARSYEENVVVFASVH